jgi:hypothetical protein
MFTIMRMYNHENLDLDNCNTIDIMTIKNGQLQR